MSPAVSSWTIILLLGLGAVALAGCSGDPERGAPDDDPAAARAPPFSEQAVRPGAYDTSGPYARVLTPGPYRPLAGVVTSIPSVLDNEPIVVGFIRPDVPDGERVPIILHASPYLPPLEAASLATMDDAEVHASFLVGNFVPHGYAVAWINNRGTGGSGGCYDLWGPKERADLLQGVRWLVDQEWASGAVGVIGGSLGAMAAWNLARTAEPAIKTIVPMRSEPDTYSWLVRNGTLSYAASPLAAPAFRAFAETGQWQWQDADRGGQEYAPPPERTIGRPCEDYAAPLLQLFSLSVDPSRPDGGFLHERDHRADVAGRYRGSILLVHGLQDFFAPVHMVAPWAASLADEGIVVKQVLGQWKHDQPDAERADTRRWDWAETLLDWFDHWLKGETDADLGPRVEVADNAGVWRREEVWPPDDAVWAPYPLGAGGTLGGTDAAGTALVLPDPDRAAFDPTQSSLGAASGELARPWESCETCVVFRSAALDAPLRVAGLPRLHFDAVPSGPGGTVSAYFLAEDGDGATTRLGWGQIDLRFAAGGDEAQPVTQGTPLAVRLEFEPLDVVVPSGSRLMLVLGQGGYGDSFFYYRASTPAYPVEVRLGDGAAVLSLPVIDRPEAVFFDAPGS